MIAQRLGVEIREGAVVAGVEPGGPAAQAGLEPGDVLVNAGERDVRSIEDLLAALRGRRPGDRLSLTLVRGGQRRTVDVRLGERPA